MKLIGIVRRKLTSDATKMTGIKSASEMTVRISGMLTGVLIKATVIAAIIHTIATVEGIDGISKLIAMPTAAPTKNIGKIMPPRKPA